MSGFSWQAMLAGIDARVAREVEKKCARLEWDEENELIRGRHRIPKKERPTCGARCRSGNPCLASAVWEAERDEPRNGRCRLHGGLSTGPRTAEGRARLAEYARRRAWAKGYGQPKPPLPRPVRCGAICADGLRCAAWVLPGSQEGRCYTHTSWATSRRRSRAYGKLWAKASLVLPWVEQVKTSGKRQMPLSTEEGSFPAGAQDEYPQVLADPLANLSPRARAVEGADAAWRASLVEDREGAYGHDDGDAWTG